MRRLVAADVVCAPSLGGESFGVVLLEAMAARAVVVASDIDGYRLAAGGHAVLVAPGDVAPLTEGLVRALGVVAEPRRQSRRQAGRPPPGEGGGTPADRKLWLDGGAEWAAHWSMGRLAEWYEVRYRSAVVRPGA